MFLLNPAQAKLALLEEAKGVLGQEYLLGVVAERMVREGGGAGEEAEGWDGGGVEGSSQMRPRRRQVLVLVLLLLLLSRSHSHSCFLSLARSTRAS